MYKVDTPDKKKQALGNHNCSSQQFSTHRYTIFPFNEARTAFIFSIYFSITLKNISPHSALPRLT
jgi:hypothetical protein